MGDRDVEPTHAFRTTQYGKAVGGEVAVARCKSIARRSAFLSIALVSKKSCCAVAAGSCPGSPRKI